MKGHVPSQLSSVLLSLLGPVDIQARVSESTDTQTLTRVMGKAYRAEKMHQVLLSINTYLQ